MEEYVSAILIGYLQGKHGLYKSQKGTHKMPFFLELRSQFNKTLFPRYNTSEG